MSKNLDANTIKRLLSPLDFYRYELPNVKIKRDGWNDGGLCPFHADKATGSFRINTATGAFKCFACGEAGSDVIAFTMALHGLNFIEALTTLADEWGLI